VQTLGHHLVHVCAGPEARLHLEGDVVAEVDHELARDAPGQRGEVAPGGQLVE
jgi:hypothetical protein